MKYVMVLVLPVLLIAFAAGQRAGPPTALDAWLAIARGDAEELRSLLERGLDPDAGFGEVTLLMHAANEGQSGCVGVLVRAAAAVDRATDCNGATALTWAAWKGTDASVRSLLHAGADVNVRMIQGWTPLMFAAMSGDVEKVTSLLAAGADVHARTTAGSRAADIAEDWGHARVADLLRRVRPAARGAAGLEGPGLRATGRTTGSRCSSRTGRTSGRSRASPVHLVGAEPVDEVDNFSRGRGKDACAQTPGASYGEEANASGQATPMCMPEARLIPSAQ